MYLIKNAWKSIVRAPGRNILIGIIVVLIAISSCVALSIRNSANEVVESYQESADITGTLGVDREAMRSQMQTASGSEGVRNMNISFSQPTYEEIINYGDSDYLNGFYYTINASLNSTDIDPVTSTTDTTTSASTSDQQAPPDGGGDMGSRMGTQADFTLIGYSSNEAMTSFVSGDYTMSEGEMFADDETGNVCVISDELAAMNDLVIGSVITMVNPNDETSTLALTVSGIYQDNSADDTSFNWFSNAANQILTNFTVLNQYVESTDDTTEDTTTDTETESTAVRGQITSTFLIKSADSIEPFEAEMRTKGLDDNLTLSTNLDNVESQLAPVSNLSNFATIFLVLVLIIGGVILLVINMINIRERKYEVGVLRAIGMNRTKVAFQYISELFIVTTFAVMVGTSIGAIASVPTANMMLANEISAQTTSQTQTEQNFGRGGMGGAGATNGGPGGFFGITETTTYVDQINAVINPIVILELAGISILLTLLSGVISVVFIARYEPLKILSNR